MSDHRAFFICGALQHRLGSQAACLHLCPMAGIGVDDGRQRRNLGLLFDRYGYPVQAYQKQPLARNARRSPAHRPCSRRTGDLQGHACRGHRAQGC